MPIGRRLNFQVMFRIKMHRNASEPSCDEELSNFLSCGRRWPFWIHVDHLSRAINDHAKLGHLMRTEQAIKVWPGDEIDLIFVGNLDGNIGKSAVAHRQRSHGAYSSTFGISGDTDNVTFSLFYSQSDSLCARPVNQCLRATAIDHQSRAPAVHHGVDEQMISESPL